MHKNKVCCLLLLLCLFLTISASMSFIDPGLALTVFNTPALHNSECHVDNDLLEVSHSVSGIFPLGKTSCKHRNNTITIIGDVVERMQLIIGRWHLEYSRANTRTENGLVIIHAWLGRRG